MCRKRGCDGEQDVGTRLFRLLVHRLCCVLSRHKSLRRRTRHCPRRRPRNHLRFHVLRAPRPLLCVPSPFAACRRCILRLWMFRFPLVVPLLPRHRPRCLLCVLSLLPSVRRLLSHHPILGRRWSVRRPLQDTHLHAAASRRSLREFQWLPLLLLRRCTPLRQQQQGGPPLEHPRFINRCNTTKLHDNMQRRDGTRNGETPQNWRHVGQKGHMEKQRPRHCCVDTLPPGGWSTMFRCHYQTQILIMLRHFRRG